MEVALYKRKGKRPTTVLYMTVEEYTKIGAPDRVRLEQVGTHTMSLHPSGVRAKIGDEPDPLSALVSFIRRGEDDGVYRAQLGGKEKIPYHGLIAFGMTEVETTDVKLPNDERGLQFNLTPSWLYAAKPYKPVTRRLDDNSPPVPPDALVVDDRELEQTQLPLLRDRSKGSALASLVVDLNRAIQEQGARARIKEDGLVAVEIPTWKEV